MPPLHRLVNERRPVSTRRAFVVGACASGFGLTLSASSFAFAKRIRNGMSVQALLGNIETIIQKNQEAPAHQHAFKQLLHNYQLTSSVPFYRDFVRINIMHEALRSGGYWRLRWTITNRKPQSDAIWKQWRAWTTSSLGNTFDPTANAECDELSAIFSYFVYRLGVRGIGLCWPVWNHTVAVWQIPKQYTGGKNVRWMIPTSQIMLPKTATIGSRQLDVETQKTIYEYRRNDFALRQSIPADLSTFFLQELERFASSSTSELQTLRAQRLQAMQGTDFGW